ncbi:MAG: replication protein [Planctomycetaceae bacterium]|nr:replication protein [Planctomycetaceae bacterium]
MTAGGDEDTQKHDFAAFRECDDTTLQPIRPLGRIGTRLVLAHERIAMERPDRADFLHTVMCQVGLPRRSTEARTFERHSGHVSVLLEAGKLYDGMRWVDQPLPYGATPRLVLVHVSSEAIRTGSRTVEIGDSMRDFLSQLGMSDSGGARGGYTALRRQMQALAACRLTLGMNAEGRVVTKDAKPFSRFEAWLQQEGTQHTLWPGLLELTPDFFETLKTHAVPLDYRALAALKHSALALDVYTWLAHRLCRVTNQRGTMVSWGNLHDQFGQEYGSRKDFKKQFQATLTQVLAVYPDARVERTPGGLILRESRPPLPKTRVAVPTTLPVDK